MHSNPDKNHHHRNGGEWQRREAQLGEWGVAGLELAPKTETHYYPIQRSWTPLRNNKKGLLNRRPKWRWRGSNPRPNKEPQSFLHV